MTVKIIKIMKCNRGFRNTCMHIRVEEGSREVGVLYALFRIEIKAYILEKIAKLCAPLVWFSLSEWSFKHLGDKTLNISPVGSLFYVL